MKKFLKLCLPAIIVLVALAGIMTFVFKNVKKPKFTVESEAFSFVEKISKMNLVDGYYSVLTLDRSGVSVKPDEGWVKVKSGAVEDFTFYYVDAKKDELPKNVAIPSIDSFMEQISEVMKENEAKGNFHLKEKKTKGKVSMGVVRTTYLIDENGMIIRAFDKVKAADNPAQMLEELE